MGEIAWLASSKPKGQHHSHRRRRSQLVRMHELQTRQRVHCRLSSSVEHEKCMRAQFFDRRRAGCRPKSTTPVDLSDALARDVDVAACAARTDADEQRLRSWTLAAAPRTSRLAVDDEYTVVEYFRCAFKSERSCF